MADPTSVQVVPATGPPLGIGDDLDFSSVTVPMPKGENYAVIFGADGVINHHMRRSKRIIFNFAMALKEHVQQAIIDYPENDDKTLV